MSGFYEVYEKARKLAQACVRQRKAAGENPDLPVLDLLLKEIPHHPGKPAGLQEILTDRIVGTCHAARTESFAWNYMPLLDSDSEFAAKWMNLYQSASSEGLRDPISVYEVYGRYFTEEGNKRVSVTKYMQNPQISANVRPLILDLPDGEERRLYEEYLHFCSISGIDSIVMSRQKNYRTLLKMLHLCDEQPANPAQKESLLSLYYVFEHEFEKRKGSQKLKATSGDAFLLYLSVYGITPDKIITQAEMEKELEKLWPDIEAYPNKKDAVLRTEEPDQQQRRRLLSDLFREPLRVFFIESSDGAHSEWSEEHDQGIQELKDTLGSQIQVEVLTHANSPQEIEQALKNAISEKAEVVFTTNPTMLQQTSQFAAKYPKIRFLNCSLNPDTGPLRTYYARDYEVKFLMGLAAGILSDSGNIGYIADFPIYGTIAAINAFAIGVQMVLPTAKIYLDWSTTQSATLPDFPRDVDMLYLEGQSFDPRVQKGKKFGLFDVRIGKFLHLADIHVNWGVFYTRICRSILGGGYSREEQFLHSDSINYWLGLSNGLLSIKFSDDLPEQSGRLIQVMEQAMKQETFYIFDAPMKVSSGSIQALASPLSYEEVAGMNWLNENVVGSIPKEEQLVPEAEEFVMVHGIEDAKDTLEEDSSPDQSCPSDPSAEESRKIQ